MKTKENAEFTNKCTLPSKLLCTGFRVDIKKCAQKLLSLYLFSQADLEPLKHTKRSGISHSILLYPFPLTIINPEKKIILTHAGGKVYFLVHRCRGSKRTCAYKNTRILIFLKRSHAAFQPVI